MGAGQHLCRMRRGQTIQRLVHVHHQPVQAVAAGIGDPGEFGDVRQFERVGGLLRYRPFERGQALPRLAALSCIPGLYRPEHGGDIVPDRHFQAREAGRREPIARH